MVDAGFRAISASKSFRTCHLKSTAEDLRQENKCGMKISVCGSMRNASLSTLPVRLWPTAKLRKLGVGVTVTGAQINAHNRSLHRSSPARSLSSTPSLASQTFESLGRHCHQPNIVIAPSFRLQIRSSKRLWLRLSWWCIPQHSACPLCSNHTINSDDGWPRVSPSPRAPISVAPFRAVCQWAEGDWISRMRAGEDGSFYRFLGVPTPIGRQIF